jgi:pseudouridine kinase
LGYVVVLGGANLDIAGIACHPLVMGDSNPAHIHSAPGGVARNVAENLARLGINVTLLCAVGDDIFGHNLLASTSEAGVDISHCWTFANDRTATYLSLHDTAGDMRVAVNDMDIMARITPQLLASQSTLLAQANAIVVDCNLTHETLHWICTHCAHIPIFADAVSGHKCVRIAPVLEFLHTLKLNQLEAAALSGFPCRTLADAQGIAQWMHARHVKHIVISLGAQGLFWSVHHSGNGWLEPVACDVVNTTGAGDALTAGLVYAFMQQQTFAQAAQFAQGCASFTLSSAKANHPDLSVAVVNHLLSPP